MKYFQNLFNPFKRNKDVSTFIFYYFMDVNGEGSFKSLDSLQIIDITSRKEDNTLVVKIKLRRPGLLIGKGGRDIDKLTEDISINFYGEYEKVKILIEEDDLWSFSKYKQ